MAFGEQTDDNDPNDAENIIKIAQAFNMTVAEVIDKINKGWEPPKIK